MKRLFLVGLVMLSYLVSSAHVGTQQCSAEGWFTYTWAFLPKSVSSVVISRHGYSDTTIAVTAASNVTTFRADLHELVLFKFNDGYPALVVTRLPCTVDLPVTYRPGTFKGTYVNGATTFKWSMDMEQNADYYQVLDSNGNVVSRVNSLGDTSITRSYTTSTVYLANLATEAFVMFCLIGVAIGLFKRRKYFMNLYVSFLFGYALLLGFVSCTKSSARPDQKTTQHAIYTLTETDKDGTTSIVANCIVNIN